MEKLCFFTVDYELLLDVIFTDNSYKIYISMMLSLQNSFIIIFEKKKNSKILDFFLENHFFLNFQFFFF